MELIHGHCLKILKKYPNNIFDSIVTDPPYGIKFMGNKWDYTVPSVEIWRECLRVLKPGGLLFSFASPKTQHRMAVNIEDAGFEIRDMIMWVYGSGMPKGKNISKGIDKKFGKIGKVIGKKIYADGHIQNSTKVRSTETGVYGFSKKDTPDPSEMIILPETELAKKWEGWQSDLKPSMEPITIARKPFSGTVVDNVLKWGTGALNIDACRIPVDLNVDDPRLGGEGSWKTNKAAKNVYAGGFSGTDITSSVAGRYPANLIHDGSEEVLKQFPNTKSGTNCIRKKPHKTSSMSGTLNLTGVEEISYGDAGNASRFFYCAKATKEDRGEGNNHNTVKPNALMRYLCKMATQPGGLILDPFMGSGSTGKAALQEGFDFVGIELIEKHYEIAKKRVKLKRSVLDKLKGQ